MRKEVFIGIDNGVSGSIAIISKNGVVFQKTPIIKALNYTKSKQWVNRIDGLQLGDLVYENVKSIDSVNKVCCLIERPMINPGRWKASMSAIRALEATLIVLESISIPYSFLDSKEWQKELLPKGCSKEELKEASLQVAHRLFPNVNVKGKDADGLLIAEYARRKYGK